MRRPLVPEVGLLQAGHHLELVTTKRSSETSFSQAPTCIVATTRSHQLREPRRSEPKLSNPFMAFPNYFKPLLPTRCSLRVLPVDERHSQGDFLEQTTRKISSFSLDISTFFEMDSLDHGS